MLRMNSLLRGIALRRVVGVRYASTTRKQLVVDSKTLKKGTNSIKDEATKISTQPTPKKPTTTTTTTKSTSTKPKSKITKETEIDLEAVEKLSVEFLEKGDITALTNNVKSITPEEAMPLYEMTKAKIDKPKAFPVELVNQFYWALFEKLILGGDEGVDGMFTIIAEKHNDNTLKFDETFYKHFFYKLLHIKNFDMAHLLYSTMTSISNIEPDILTLSIADRVANFVLSVEEKEDPKYTKFFEDAISKGVSCTLDEEGYEMLMEYHNKNNL